MSRYVFVVVLSMIALNLGQSISAPSSTVVDPILVTIQDRHIRESEVGLLHRKLLKILPEVDKGLLLSLMEKQVQLSYYADAEGLDSDTTFKEKYDANMNEKLVVGELENDVTDRVLYEAYQRSRFVLKASHILIPVQLGMLEDEIRSAFDLSLQYFKELQSAKRTWSDLSNKTAAAELNYFSVFEQAYPFENAVFALEVGEVSPPVRTRYGFHLIKLEEKKVSDEVGSVPFEDVVFELRQKIGLDHRVERHMAALFQKEAESEIVDELRSVYRERILAARSLSKLLEYDVPPSTISLLDLIRKNIDKIESLKLDQKFPTARTP